MPKRDDIAKIMIIGSGPVVIGQACEFDYAGAQACAALKGLGYSLVLVNSSPAAITTDPGVADATYIEPLTLPTMEAVMARERPDAVLPTLGGQTGLNLASRLLREGVLDRHGVKIIGTNAQAIECGENRIAFTQLMDRLGIETPGSGQAGSIEAAEKTASSLGYPVVIRPAYPLGGTGGGLVYNPEELRAVAGMGLSASAIGQVLVEKSVLGWEEFELEVLRDGNNSMVTACFIENIDAMGVHTGDSLAVVPMLTAGRDFKERLQKHAFGIMEALGVIGCMNIQFARESSSGRIVVVEVNPRFSRTSALASKATGFPIAGVSAKLAAGITLDELPSDKGTLARYEPPDSRVAVKFPRWNFERLKGSEDWLGTRMKAVGEVMGIGKTYKEALQKAVRSLEIGRAGLGGVPDIQDKDLAALLEMLGHASSERQFILYEALRKGAGVDDLSARTRINPWFIGQMKELVDLEERIISHRGGDLPADLLVQAKKDGFGDSYLAGLLGTSPGEIRAQVKAQGLVLGWEAIPTTGTGNAGLSYSTCNAPDSVKAEEGKKILVLGSGPNRIGQGIEYDYCCVHAASAISGAGFKPVMVNCNPQTVSTDSTLVGRLYFEPLDVDAVLAIIDREQPEGVVLQFGGKTPLGFMGELADAGVRVLGTAADAMTLVGDRGRFRAMLDGLGIPTPDSGSAGTAGEAVGLAGRMGYPIMARPSGMPGGDGMAVMHSEELFREYLRTTADIAPDRPVLVDKVLDKAVVAEVDAVSDGSEAFVPAVMEHIEHTGVHAGDSACVIPPISIPPRHLDTIIEYTGKIALGLGVVGLMNVQYAIHEDRVYVLEVNPRASRTVALVSKVCNIPLTDIAMQVILGARLSQFSLSRGVIPYFGVKEAVFPFTTFPEVDPLLGPEMHSTGEVLGLAPSFGLAFFKASEAASQLLPREGTVLITVSSLERPAVLEAAKLFSDLGFKLKTTRGTHEFLTENGVASERVLKLHEGRPNIVDGIKNREYDLIINTPSGKLSKHDDSYIRKAAIRYKVPYITTLAAAIAAARGIEAFRGGMGSVKTLQEYHKDIRG